MTTHGDWALRPEINRLEKMVDDLRGECVQLRDEKNTLQQRIDFKKEDFKFTASDFDAECQRRGLPLLSEISGLVEENRSLKGSGISYRKTFDRNIELLAKVEAQNDEIARLQDCLNHHLELQEFASNQRASEHDRLRKATAKKPVKAVKKKAKK